MARDHSAFIKNFFATSDTQDVDNYLTFLAPEAQLIMGLKSFTGHDQIRVLREGMWAAVATRHHVVTKVYPSNTEDELMLFGTVDYELKNGKKLSSDWAGRMVFDEAGEKMKFYQVWLDASPVVVALGKTIVADESGINIKVV